MRVFKKVAAILLLLLMVSPVFQAVRTYALFLQSLPQLELDAEYDLQKFAAAAKTVPSDEDTTLAKQFAQRVLLGDAPAPVLSAKLQDELRSMATSHGIFVTQASETASDLANSSHKIGLKLDLAGPAAQVLAFINEVERKEPWLQIESAQIRSGFIDSSPLTFEPNLTASLEIWGSSLINVAQ